MSSLSNTDQIQKVTDPDTMTNLCDPRKPNGSFMISELIEEDDSQRRKSNIPEIPNDVKNQWTDDDSDSDGSIDLVRKFGFRGFIFHFLIVLFQRQKGYRESFNSTKMWSVPVGEETAKSSNGIHRSSAE